MAAEENTAENLGEGIASSESRKGTTISSKKRMQLENPTLQILKLPLIDCHINLPPLQQQQQQQQQLQQQQQQQ
ncbi:hypothetical protein EPH_0063330 [Eimeria praecox]|uniref:Uncharacterized protein n=1 Tax=Eimeria praecox TaxID=51316 RepID=U6H0J8_9EIME|nr:hypothetical protein EPH_0063330 [Eimeria praecox]